MGWTADALAALERRGFRVLDYFPLPDEAWWEDFYTAMERRFEVMREQYAGDLEALTVIERLVREPELHRLCSDYYAYEFFLARRYG